MAGPRPGRVKSTKLRESVSGPSNYRDASGSSGNMWKEPPTVISTPANDKRHQRPQDNPYVFTSNLSDPKFRRPGNPNVRQTLLAKHRSGNLDADSHVQKRQRLDVDISSGPPVNGASSSSARKPAPRGNFPEPDIQPIEPRRRTNNYRTPVPNDAEIIEIGSDDLGERVHEASPDPLLLRSSPHPFETHPTESTSSASNKGKGRAKELISPVVRSSEGLEEIEQYPSPPRTDRRSNCKKSPGIPRNIVKDRKNFFEGTSISASAPAAIRYPVEPSISVNLINGRVVGQMKKKDGDFGDQGNTDTSDPVGTSSSNFTNVPRANKRTRVLPLEACCIGLHFFQHSDATPLTLEYEFARQTVKVIWNQSPLESIEFKLGTQVRSAIIVNDTDEPLKTNPLVQFKAAQGQNWEGVERRFKGFKGGVERSQGSLTFRFPTPKNRGFNVTDYQNLVTGIRKAFKASAVQIIRPQNSIPVWEYAYQCACMFEQTESRRKEDHSEHAINESLEVAGLASVKLQASCAESSLNGDPGPPIPQRRSLRQSVIRSSRISPPPLPPDQPEPDEIILMYPPTGTGALSIMQSDLRRLQPEEYLNDTLIEFGLKLWLNDLREKNPTLADQIHVFSSFFYKKLNNRKNPEDGYKSVRKWTSKVDLFAKKYIIVPINENIHWYLAVIYEPGHTLEPPLSLSHTSNVRLTRKRKHVEEHAEVNVETAAVSEPARAEVSLKRSHFSLQTPEVGQDTDASSVNATRATTPSTTGNAEIVVDKSCPATIGSEPVSVTSSEDRIRDSSPPFNLIYPPSNMDVDTEMSVIDIAPDASSEIAEVSDPPMSKPLSEIPTSRFYGTAFKPQEAQPVDLAEKEDSSEDQEQEAEVDDMLAVPQSSSSDWPAQTYILTLDSLGTRHPQAIKVLKQYLVREAKDKRNFDEVRDAVGKQVQVPVQPNSWDCGIYLLHFVRAFMNHPSEFFEKIISTRGTMPSSKRKQMWHDHEIPQYRDYLKSRVMKLSEEWKTGKTINEETNKQNGDVIEVETLTSEGEVDIVEDTPSVKLTSRLRQRRPATRLRG